MSEFIEVTEIYKDGRTRRALLSIEHIVTITEELDTKAKHRTIIYCNQPKRTHTFVTESFSWIKEKLNVKR